MNAGLLEIAALFAKLGATAFGGPAAHVAMMHEEVVKRRQWMSDEEFLDLVGATNLIPGPNSTELAIHIGHRQAGWSGLLVAGACFILPATIIVSACAWAYVEYGSLPQAAGLLYGVKPVIIVIVLQALWSLGRSAIKTKTAGVICIAGILLSLVGLHELLILALSAAVAAAGRATRRLLPGALGVGPFVLLAQSASAPAAAATTSFGIWPLFLFFVKVGSVLFGSGYVLLAFLRADLVERWHWLSESQLLDAVAVGQVTPGPVFTTATFIGYLLGGVGGAAVATLGIFLPAFFFVTVSGPLVPKLRRSPTAGAILDGVNAASLALMAVVSYELCHSALVDLPSILLGLLSALGLIYFRVNSAWLVLGGAIAGLLLRAFG
ncbi:MAG: chromate efflux transporter [Bryobacter sp.]|nr:chromate efflux transporter [Bryobacter sp.]